MPNPNFYFILKFGEFRQKFISDVPSKNLTMAKISFLQNFYNFAKFLAGFLKINNFLSFLGLGADPALESRVWPVWVQLFVLRSCFFLLALNVDV